MSLVVNRDWCSMEGNHCKGTMHTGTTDPALHPDKRSRWKPRCLAVEVQKETALSVVNCIKCFSTKAIPKVLQTSKEIRSCPVLGNLLTNYLSKFGSIRQGMPTSEKNTHQAGLEKHLGRDTDSNWQLKSG